MPPCAETPVWPFPLLPSWGCQGLPHELYILVGQQSAAIGENIS